MAFLTAELSWLFSSVILHWKWVSKNDTSPPSHAVGPACSCDGNWVLNILVNCRVNTGPEELAGFSSGLCVIISRICKQVLTSELAPLQCMNQKETGFALRLSDVFCVGKEAGKWRFFFFPPPVSWADLLKSIRFIKCRTPPELVWHSLPQQKSCSLNSSASFCLPFSFWFKSQYIKIFVSCVLMFFHFVYKQDRIWAIRYARPINLHKVAISF